MSERNMFCWGSVSPIWTPMCGDDQQIYCFFRLSYHFKKLLGSFVLQDNRDVKDAWLFFCCFPTRLVIGKGDQSEFNAVDFPHRWLGCVTERRACTSIVNASHIQIVHCV